MKKLMLISALVVSSIISSDGYDIAGLHYNTTSNHTELSYANDTNFVYGVEMCTNLQEGIWFRQADTGMVYNESSSNRISVAGDGSQTFYYRMVRLPIGHSGDQVTSQNSWLLRTENTVHVDDITLNDVLGNSVYYYTVSNYVSATYVEVFVPPGGFVETWAPDDFTIPAGKQFLYTMVGGGDGYTELPFSYAGQWELIHPDGPAPRTMTVRIEWDAVILSDPVENPAPDYCAVVTITGPHGYVKRFEPVYNAGHVNWNSLEEPDELDHFAWEWDQHQKPDDGYYTITVEIKDAPTRSTGIGAPTIGTIVKEVYLYNW